MSKAKESGGGPTAGSTANNLFPTNVEDPAHEPARQSPLSAYTGPAISLPERIFGVGWAISDRSISSNDPRHVATVVTFDQAFHNGRHGDPKERVTRRFILEIRSKWSPSPEEDVSGLLGLLSPWGTPDDREAHAKVERALAEIQIWALYQCLEEAKKEKRPTAILLQGPLLPKLRGRIFYRMLDATMNRLYVITSESRCVRQLTGDGHGQARPGIVSENQPDRSVPYAWKGPLPDLALDAPGRSFIGTHLGRSMVHAYVPANVLPPKKAKQFFGDRAEELRQLFKNTESCELHSAIQLPVVLARAVSAAESAKNDLLDQLRGVERLSDALLRFKTDKARPLSALAKAAIESWTKEKYPTREAMAAENLGAAVSEADFREALAKYTSTSGEGAKMELARLGRGE